MCDVSKPDRQVQPHADAIDFPCSQIWLEHYSAQGLTTYPTPVPRRGPTANEIRTAVFRALSEHPHFSAGREGVQLREEIHNLSRQLSEMRTELELLRPKLGSPAIHRSAYKGIAFDGSIAG